MDQVRQIRFLIPPLVMLASVLWGAVCDPRSLQAIFPWMFAGEHGIEWVSVIAGGGVVLLSLGFILGTVTYGVLRLLFLASFGKTHEVGGSKETLGRIAKKIGLGRDPSPHEALYIIATFDHGQLPEGVHNWIVRRWNGFNINAASAMSLIASLCASRMLGIALVWMWWLPVVVLTVTFVAIAVSARNEMIRMIELHSELKYGTK